MEMACFYASCGTNVIVLEKNAVGKIIAVVIAAAYANGIFLENTVVRGGFLVSRSLIPVPSRRAATWLV